MSFLELLIIVVILSFSIKFSIQNMRYRKLLDVVDDLSQQNLEAIDRNIEILSFMHKLEVKKDIDGKVIELYKKGYTAEKIVKMVPLSLDTVSQIIKSHVEMGN